jgi:hypothetical protein
MTHEHIDRKAEEVMFKRARHLHLSVLEQTLGCLVRLLGIKQTKAILEHYVQNLEEY